MNPIAQFLCTHEYEERFLNTTLGELVEECAKCGKTRKRSVSESST